MIENSPKTSSDGCRETVFWALRFALPASSSDLAAKGLLWVAIVFTALVGLQRAFVVEREHGVIDGLVLAPIDRSAIWFGKALAVFGFLAAVEVIALPAYSIFFSPVNGKTIAAVALADVGICAVGTFVAARARAPAPLPAACDPGRDRWGGCERQRRRRSLPRLPRPVRRGLCDHLLGLL